MRIADGSRDVEISSDRPATMLDYFFALLFWIVYEIFSWPMRLALQPIPMRGDLRRDLRDKGETDIPDSIKKEIKAGRCDCERKNPSGACCLGNVTKAIKQIRAE